MSYLVLLCLTLAGFAALSLSMKRHQRQVIGRNKRLLHAFAYRPVGASLICVGIVLACHVYGWGRGLIIFFGIATVSAFTIAAVLSLRPQTLGVICRARPWSADDVHKAPKVMK